MAELMDQAPSQDLVPKVSDAVHREPNEPEVDTGPLVPHLSPDN